MIVRLQGSTQSPGGTLSYGRLGVATTTLAGGTLEFSPATAGFGDLRADYRTVRLHRPIRQQVGFVPEFMTGGYNEVNS